MNTITKRVVYPHAVLLLKKAILFFLFFTVPVSALIFFFCPEEYKTMALAYVATGTGLFLLYAGLNYTHTKTTIEEAGLLVQQGWIPNRKDSIFWLHIKDVNAKAGVLESLFRCGTILIKVTVRNYEETIALEFLQNYTEVFEIIRAKIAEQNKDARPMTYS